MTRCDFYAGQLFLFARGRIEHHLFRTRCGSTARARRPARPAAGHRPDPGLTSHRRRTACPAERRAQRQRRRNADALPKEYVGGEQRPVEHRVYDDGGPLHAASSTCPMGQGDVVDFGASAADVEHGLYLTSAGTATSPAAPGCNNGASTCAGHGLAMAIRITVQPMAARRACLRSAITCALHRTSSTIRQLHDVQVELGVRQPDQTGAVRDQGATRSYDVPFLQESRCGVLTAGFRFADRKVDQELRPLPDRR